MLVIVEGVDGSGKTTLVNQLKEQGYKVVPAIPRDEPNQFDKWSEYVDSDEICIVDRSFITDMVYRAIDRQKPCNITLRAAAWLLKRSKLILCESNTAYEDAMRRGEDNITDFATSCMIKFTYVTLFRIFQMYGQTEIMSYDWKKQTLNEVIQFITGSNINNKEEQYGI